MSPTQSILWKPVRSSSSIRVAGFRSRGFRGRRQRGSGVRGLDFTSESGHGGGIIPFPAKQRVKYDDRILPTEDGSEQDRLRKTYCSGRSASVLLVAPLLPPVYTWFDGCPGQCSGGSRGLAALASFPPEGDEFANISDILIFCSIHNLNSIQNDPTGNRLRTQDAAKSSIAVEMCPVQVCAKPQMGEGEVSQFPRQSRQLLASA